MILMQEEVILLSAVFSFLENHKGELVREFGDDIIELIEDIHNEADDKDNDWS